MRLYNAEGSSASVGGRCCGSRDLEDARSVCAKLDIPFYVVNYQAQFQSVIDDFVESYAKGETPSPCVRCNERIKFLPLLHRARALGATRLYTGHYARIRNSNGCPGLYRAKDLGKDQSYFLFGMPRDSLTFVDFPLGDMTKTEVKAEARRLGLPNADKPDSQEICFIPDGRYSEFVASRIPAAAGDIVDVDSGAVVGTHEGIHNFTIGQRVGRVIWTASLCGEH
jgi:tRNA-specific 2-thiouridylase